MSHNKSMPFQEHSGLLNELIQKIAYRRGLSPDDVRDFAQTVQLKLLESDYAIFRRFKGHSSLRTYLGVAVTRLLQDWQNHTWGKWRPSAAAQRLGPHAVRLERLVNRDGFTIAEAIEVLRSEPGALPLADLQATADSLPARTRRRMVSDEMLWHVAGPQFEDPVAAEEQAWVDEQIRGALGAALAELPEDDRRLIEARYQHDVNAAAAAWSMERDVKAVYRRCERVLRTLRATLIRRGVVGPGQVTVLR